MTKLRSQVDECHLSTESSDAEVVAAVAIDSAGLEKRLAFLHQKTISIFKTSGSSMSSETYAAGASTKKTTSEATFVACIASSHLTAGVAVAPLISPVAVVGDGYGHGKAESGEEKSDVAGELHFDGIVCASKARIGLVMIGFVLLDLSGLIL